MPLDPAPLNAAANTIRSETGFKRNTAIRIGDMFLNLIAALGTIELTPGPNGLTAYEVALANGFVGTQSAWLASLVGAAGQSAYQVAVAGGFVGDQSAWLASLVGAAGANSIVTRTSSTSREVGLGLKTFTYTDAPNLGWVFGQRLRASYLGNYMEGTVDSVSSTVVTINVDTIGGSGTHAGWTIGIAGAQGSPDTAAQIRDKINTLTGEDRLAVAVLKDFITEVLAQINAEVDLYNTEQLGQDFEGKTEIKGLRRAKTGTSITFKNPISTYGTLEAPITTMTISDLTGAIPFNKSFVFIQSLSVPAMIADEVANGGLTTIIPTGTFNTASNAINIIELEYINDSFVNAKMQSVLVGDPIDSSIFLLLNYDENKNLTIDNSLDNSSLYPDDVEPFVLNAGDASYTLVSGANYDLETGVNATASSRAQHQASVSIAAKAAFIAGTNIASTSTNSVGTGSKVFTYASTLDLTWIEGVTRVRARSGANWVEGVVTTVSTTSVTINVDTTGGSGSFSSWVLNQTDRGITIIRGFRKTSTTAMSLASNQDDAATSGVRFSVGTTGTMTVRINGVNATVASGINQTNMFWFAMTYNLATGETKVSRKSPGAGFAFSTILTSSAHLSQALNFGGTADLWWFERNNFASTTPQGVTNRLNYISNRILSDAEIEALMV